MPCIQLFDVKTWKYKHHPNLLHPIFLFHKTPKQLCFPKSYSTVYKLSLSSWLLTLLVAIDFYYCCIAMHLYSPYFRPIQSTMPSTCQSHGEGLMVLIQFERNQDWGRHRNNLLLVSPLSLLIRFGVQGGDCPSQDGRGQLQIWAQDRLQIMFYHFFTSNTSLVWLF